MDEVRVRIGTPADLDDIMRLALSAVDENGFLPPNPQRLLADIWPSLHRDHGVMGIIGRPGEACEGTVLLRIGNLWYSDTPVVEEKAVFVRPEFRSAKGGRARKLCEFSKMVADELGFPLVIGILSNHRTQGKVKLYERMFGEPAGAYFLYGSRTGEWKKAMAAE
jgi:hypothetical protein